MAISDTTDIPDTATTRSRQRVPAAERRDALIEAAVHEFAQTGLHGTPVDRIARAVGVAQPYVFSLFHSKRELFLAAVERCFAIIDALMERAAAEFDPAIALPETNALGPMANAYIAQLEENRDLLLLQHQAYAACGDEQIRPRVRECYERLERRVKELSGADEERIKEFMRYGMWINVNATLGTPDVCQPILWRRPEGGDAAQAGGASG